MKLARTTLYGSIAAATLCLASGPSFAIEMGDFGNVLRGATIGTPLGAAPPPGVYAGWESLYGVNNPGERCNSAGQCAGAKVDAIVGAMPVIWAPGWNFLGGSVVLDVIQPFFEVDFQGVHNEPPAQVAWFPEVHNTVFEARDSWNWKNGWFTSLGMTVAVPDGSQYLGSLNPDYASYVPNAAISYLDKNWVLSANMFYEINASSRGHTGMGGFGQLWNAPNQAPAPGCIGPLAGPICATAGSGYKSGDEFFLDLAALYKTGKWAIGPVAYIKAQTTSDRPGGGFTCASLANSTFNAEAAIGAAGIWTSCGKEEDIALGGAVGYNFGPVDLNVWITDTVACRDTFCGLNVWSSLTFRLWGPEAAAAAPMVSKAK